MTSPNTSSGPAEPTCSPPPPATARGPRSPHTPRQRLGWLLVHAGLRLVTAHGDRPQLTLPA
ncbi:hypothetical protein [Amycolatopsis sp. NPDC051903]|uniref:hypothetical protein n=1 Tax=Amycolatopsis sp. NPDC051903 TaxID=3363936 RepID=UPI00379693FB